MDLSNSQHKEWKETIAKDIIMKFQRHGDKKKLLNTSREKIIFYIKRTIFSTTALETTKPKSNVFKVLISKIISNLKCNL